MAGPSASSFTVKASLIEETYAVFAAWDSCRPPHENFRLLRETNAIGASSASWLRDIAKILHRRFEPTGKDRALVHLAKGGLPLSLFRPILL